MTMGKERTWIWCRRILKFLLLVGILAALGTALLGVVRSFLFHSTTTEHQLICSCNHPLVISDRESMELEIKWFDLLEDALVQDRVNIKILQQVFFPICGSSPRSVSVEYDIFSTTKIWVVQGWSGAPLYSFFNQTILEYWLSLTMMNGFSGRNWPALQLTPRYCYNKNSVEIVLRVNTTLSPDSAQFSNALASITRRVSSLLLCY